MTEPVASAAAEAEAAAESVDATGDASAEPAAATEAEAAAEELEAAAPRTWRDWMSADNLATSRWAVGLTKQVTTSGLSTAGYITRRATETAGQVVRIGGTVGAVGLGAAGVAIGGPVGVGAAVVGAGVAG